MDLSLSLETQSNLSKDHQEAGTANIIARIADHLPTSRPRMQSPLKIACHGLQSSPALEVNIRQRVEKLERHCKNLVSCRVVGRRLQDLRP
jgi:hypothetical protein